MLKKRVVVYNNVFFEFSEAFIYLQIKFLEQYFDITLVGNEKRNANNFVLDQASIQIIDRKDPLFWRFIYKLLRRFGYYIPLGFSEAKNLKNWFRYYEADVVHAHFGYNALRILPVLKKLKIPLIVSFHGIDASRKITNQPAYFSRLPELLDYASRIIVVSPHMIETLGLSGKNKSKVVHLPYFVDIHYFNGETKSEQTDSVNILHSGRLVPKKGVLDLITVFRDLSKRFSHVRLHILGDGEDYMAAREMVDFYSISDLVVFYGSQPHKIVRELMENADIFVLNSRVAPDGDMEGLPVSLLEAMSMGKAVVSTFHAGIPYAISDGFNGLLVPERSNDELFGAIEKLICDSSLRRSLGYNAKATVEEKFDLNTVGPELAKVYNAVLEC